MQKYKFQRDRGAAYVTGRPLKLSSALTKISGRIKVAPKKELKKIEGTLRGSRA